MIRNGCGTAALVGVVSFATLGGSEALDAQIPDDFTNLRVLPTEVTRDSLLQVMRGFSFALGVRCQYCHVGGDGVSFEGVDFASDEDADKRKARFMLRMVENMNTSVLPLMADRDEPAVRMECKTCHRGISKPSLLGQDLRLVMDEEGVEAAVERYRVLRERFATSGAYDFGEWETNVVAEGLRGEGRNRDAIAIYELNAEFHPGSVSIQMSLGQLFEAENDRDAAIRSYERALELAPELEAAKERLAALGAEAAEPR